MNTTHFGSQYNKKTCFTEDILTTYEKMTNDKQQAIKDKRADDKHQDKPEGCVLITSLTTL